MPVTGSNSSGKLQFELLDEILDINNTEKLHLSIQVRLDGFLIALLDPGESRYLALRQYGFERAYNHNVHFEAIETILRSDPFLQKDYQKVSCIFTDSRSTLLPSAVFDPEHLKIYFEFNHILNDLDELHYNFIKQMDAYLLFPVHTEIAGLILKRWITAGIFHQASPFLVSLLSQAPSEGRIAGINFNDNHFDMAVIEDQKLRYHNNFSYRTNEDLLYFILFVFNKTGLSQEDTPILISGALDKFSDQPQALRRYIRKLSFQPARSDYRYPPSFQKIQDHALLNLLMLRDCE
jgi:hypothetical protein